MRIKCTTVGGEKLERSILLLLQTFDQEIQFVSEDEEATLTIEKQGNQFLGTLSINEKIYTQVIDGTKGCHWTKNPISFYTRQLVYDLFCQAGFPSQPWGILTGIRPTKLVHKMLAEGLSFQEIAAILSKQYRIDADKITLLLQIVQVQYACLPNLNALKKGVSIYIGIPFCPTKCAYCTFPAYMIPRKGEEVNRFLDALILEIQMVAPYLPDITTIYIGGGTPTSLTAEQMERLLDMLGESLPNVQAVQEFTIEAGRPDTIDANKLSLFASRGITRISINPQSFHQDTLNAIGRFHRVEEIYETYQLARTCGMKNINMDLILGLPTEKFSKLQKTLDEVVNLSPESVTVHTLALKRASHLTKNRAQYDLDAEEEMVKMMEESQRVLSSNGYRPYYLYRQKNMRANLENIGYAKEGHESLYNIIIMEEVQSIIGFGCGASSKLLDANTGKITQLHNPKDPKTFVENTAFYIEQKIKKLQAHFATG